MNRIASAQLCILLALLLQPDPAEASQLVLRNASVINVETGTVKSKQTIQIIDGRIQTVSEAEGTGRNGPAQEVDLAGRFVIPALWDMHIHPSSEEDLNLLLANGVLGARIMWGRPQHLAWRAEIELGTRQGPRLFITGPIIEGTPPPEFAGVIDTVGRRLLDTRDQGLAEAKVQKAAGFDYLKVYNNLSGDAYQGLVEGSRKFQIPIVGHIPFEVGLEAALEAGQHSIEHLRGYVQLVVPSEAPIQPGPDLRSRTLAWQFADPNRISDLVGATLESGAWECPTLNARIFFGTPEEIESYLASPAGEFISAGFKETLRDRSRIKWLSNFSEEDFRQASLDFAWQNHLLVALQKAGVPMLAGTDMAPAGFTLHEELRRLVEAGLSPAEALQAATVNPARFVGLHDFLGRIAPGYGADLLVLDKNPLEDIRHTQTIYSVVVRGELWERPRLDALLKEVSRSLD